MDTLKSFGWRSTLVVLCFVTLAFYLSHRAVAEPGGISGCTNNPKSGYNGPGCSCHSGSPSKNTKVTITGPSGTSYFIAGQKYLFTVTIANSSQFEAGLDVSAYKGKLSVSPAESDAHLVSGEITHSSPKSMSAGSASWVFYYTPPSGVSTDTVYATGNAMLGGEWNYAPKFVVNITTLSKAIALSRNTISLGQIRVGGALQDTFAIACTSTGGITVSTSWKTSGPFTSTPTAANRALSSGTQEVDTIFFVPKTGGVFTDSLIVTSNVDASLDQRKTIYVTGTGVDSILSIPSLISFGKILVNTEKDTTITIADTTEYADTVISYSLTNGTEFDFLDTGAHVIPANGNIQIQLKFIPRATGTFVDTLRLVTRDPNVPIRNIPIVGISTTPANVAEGSPSTSEFTLALTPNPAQEHTRILLNSVRGGEVAINMYDISGRDLGHIFNGLLPKGSNLIDMNTAVFQPGIYFLRATTSSGSVAVSRLLILR